MMQPDDHKYSVDYLNAIATKPAAKILNPFVLWGLIAGVLLVGVVVIMFVASAGGSPTDSLTRFGARLSSLKTVSMDAQENITSSDLRTLNSSLTLVLTNANRDLQDPLEAEDISLEDEKNSQVEQVTNETSQLTKRLEDARLNAVFDRTYAREISFYLKSLRSDMSVLYRSSSSDSLKTILNTTDDNLAPLQTGFANFTDA